MKTEKKQKPTFILSRKLHGPTQPDYLYLYLAGTGGGDVCIHESRLCLAPGDILLFSGALALKTEDSASDSRTDSRLLGFLSERELVSAAASFCIPSQRQKRAMLISLSASSEYRLGSCAKIRTAPVK